MVQYNERFSALTYYPFDRLRQLLSGIQPPSGREHIVMSIGEPQHKPPSFIREILAENATLWNRYPPVKGTQAFRSAVVEWLNRRFNLPSSLLNPDIHTLPVSGTREALYSITQLLVPQCKLNGRPIILIPNPFYQVYVGAAVMAGAEPTYYNTPSIYCTDAQLELSTSLDKLNLLSFSKKGSHKELILKKVVLFFLCSPSNPDGSVASLEYLKQAIILARHYNFVLAVDECYSEIYSDSPPPGALQACAQLGNKLNNVIVFHSLSKRSSVPGFRSGFIAGDPAIIAAFAKLRAYSGAVTPLPILAAATALWKDDSHVRENRSLYREKMDAATHILEGHFEFSRPKGTFFLWLKVGDGELAARELFRTVAIQVLPGAYLAEVNDNGYNPGYSYIRVAMTHDLETVIQALYQLRDILLRFKP